jgi:hypothetical protein
MNSLFSDISKLYLEWQGRRRTAPRYPFRENEIVSPGVVRSVSSASGGIYMNVHPTHYALLIGPDGRIINMRGGFSPLPPGRYVLHYVDKQNRVTLIPRTTEAASDGPQVSLELAITYRVIDPIKALEVQQAVDALILFIQSDLKEFIRSHKYDEIVGDLYGRKVDNELVVRYIKDQHATRHQMSRLFFIADVVIGEKVGDPRVSEIRQKIQINQWQFDADSEYQRQNQVLSEKGAAQDALLRKMQAESEAKQLEILKDVKLQQIELDNARQQFQAQQAYVQRAMDALVQAFSSQMYPLDPHVIEIMRDLVETMGGSMGRKTETAAEPKNQPPPPPDDKAKTEKIGELTNTLLNLLDRKRR